MENRSFDKVRTGDLAEACAVLFGSVHEHQKAVHATGIQGLLGEIEADSFRRIRVERDLGVWTVVASLGALMVSLFAWLAVVRSLRYGKVGLHLTVAARHQGEEKLQLAYLNLKIRIEERTAELCAANASLRTEGGGL
jgi:hypothetical protein